MHHETMSGLEIQTCDSGQELCSGKNNYVDWENKYDQKNS